MTTPTATTEYVVIEITDDMDAETAAFAASLNWQNERIAIMDARVSEIYEVFAMLKPMMGKLPGANAGGLVVPNGAGFPKKRW